MSYTRRQIKKHRVLDKINPNKVMVPIRKDDIDRVVTVDPRTRIVLYQCQERMKNDNEFRCPIEFQGVDLLEIPARYEHVDVSKALTTPGRLLYPKVARKSKLDDLLARRVQLKEAEELRISSGVVKEDDVDVVNDTPSASSSAGAATATSNNSSNPGELRNINNTIQQSYLEKKLIRLAGN